MGLEETYRERIARLVKTYALPEVEIKLLIACDDELLDGYGRMRS